MKQRPFLIIECVIVSLVLPTLLYVASPRGALFASLWGATLFLILMMKSKQAWNFTEIFAADQVRWTVMKPILKRFALSCMLLTAAVALFEPHRLLEFPRERTEIWLAVMVLYPLLSVFPQELIYRIYYFWRYQALFPSPRAMIWVSGMAFGYAHVIFNNWLAVVLSCAGGVLFSQTYSRTRSLAVVWIEHALYGCFIFTIGLGWYFYSGAVR